MQKHVESARVFMAFCDETRLRVLELLRNGEMCASALLKQINVRQPALSHHMKVLVESGIITSRKAGKWTFYSICEGGRQYAAELLKMLTASPEAVSAEFEVPGTNYFQKRTVSTMHSFTIMVDTSCDLPPEYMKEHNIESLPIAFDLDGVPHSGGYWQEISGKDYYNALRKGGVAKTTQINPGTFSEVFTEHARLGKELLVLTLSGGLSGTYQSSEIALKEVKESYPGCGIYTVDSISASVGIGLLVTLAVQKRAEGFSAGETAAWLEEKKHSCFGFFTVDDLMYLHRGGRLSKLSAVAGSILGIKPVLNLAPKGTLALKDKVRGREAALELLASQFRRSIAPDTTL